MKYYLTSIATLPQHPTVAAHSATRRENRNYLVAHSAAWRFFHARFYGGRVGQLNAGRFPLEPVSHPCAPAARHFRGWAVSPISNRGHRVRNISVFPSAERIEANIFENETNHLLAQARAILSLSGKSSATIRAAENIIGGVMSGIVDGCCCSLEGDDVPALRHLLGQAHSLLHDLVSDDAGVSRETSDLICDAASSFVALAMDFTATLCS